LRFFEIFRSGFGKYLYGVFELVMQRNGQKRDLEKSKEKNDREKVFDMDFSQKVLLNSLLQPVGC
jgi:hypothetical protein